MTHRRRHDDPVSIHHVFNRGIARRAVFETREDIRFFLSRIARQVHAGSIRVMAYAIMTTHYHLVLESVTGSLPDAMQRITLAYVRRFNRKRRRDGALFRGRFRSLRIWDAAHWFSVISYVDRNPVAAKMVTSSSEYPYGSAYHYARRKGPIWLDRSRIEAAVSNGGLAAGAEYEPARYPEVMGAWDRPDNDWVVARECSIGKGCRKSMQDLIHAATPEVWNWMVRKARLADGSRSGAPSAAPEVILRHIEKERRRRGEWKLRLARDHISGWDLVAAALLRLGSGLTYQEIATTLGTGRTTAHNHCKAFLVLGSKDPEFAQRTSRILQDAMRSTYPLEDQHILAAWFPS